MGLKVAKGGGSHPRKVRIKFYEKKTLHLPKRALMKSKPIEENVVK